MLHLCLRYLHSTSFAICTTLARFPVDSARTLGRAVILIVVSEWHVGTGGKVWRC
jgi:hypothetical protein